MHILVLGATGFIGQQVMLALRASGHDTVGLGRDIRLIERRVR